jgi:hypothetical protein
MTGTIVDGWDFIWAAFIITWTSLGLYSASLVWRERKSRNNTNGAGSES